MSAIAVASTAARNGVLVGDQLVEVNGACVVGLGDREVRRRIEQEAAAVTLTTMPQETFRAMVRGMSGWLVRNKMNHSYQCQLSTNRINIKHESYLIHILLQNCI